jgi:hypothetical protein
MTGRHASMFNQDAWARGLGSRSEQAAYQCAANVIYANEMLMNNHVFSLLMTGLKVHKTVVVNEGSFCEKLHPPSGTGTARNKSDLTFNADQTAYKIR